MSHQVGARLRLVPLQPYQQWAPMQCAMCGDAIALESMTYVAIELSGWPVIALDQDCCSALMGSMASLANIANGEPSGTLVH